MQGGIRNVENTAGDASKPLMLPVSSTPAPSASVPPATPEIVPTNDDNRATAAALAVARQGQFTGRAADAVDDAGRQVARRGQHAAGLPGPWAVRRRCWSMCRIRGGDPYRNAAPKPQKVSNNTLE